MHLVCRLCSANVTKVKRFVTRADLNELKASCETFIIEHFEELSREEQFYTSVTPLEMDHYLSLDELGVWNEDTALHVIDKWAIPKLARKLPTQSPVIHVGQHFSLRD